MALPPKRAPGRYETPESNGTPTTATSARPTSSRRGSRAKVAGPAYRGTRDESTGPRGWLSPAVGYSVLLIVGLLQVVRVMRGASGEWCGRCMVRVVRDAGGASSSVADPADRGAARPGRRAAAGPKLFGGWGDVRRLGDHGRRLGL